MIYFKCINFYYVFKTNKNGGERMISKKRREKGITLIVLVITIIILMILAGVTLRLTGSTNGVLNGAKNTTDKYDSLKTYEEDSIQKLEDKMGNP